MASDPKVDAYIAKAAPFAQPILTHLRALVHRLLPEAGETIKWGMPCFTYKDKNLAGMAAFKAHVSFGIHGDGTAIEGMGQFGKIMKLADAPPEELLAERIAAAKTRIDTAGTALRTKDKPRSPKPELPVPPEFSAALAENPLAKAALDAFAPSHRREYLEWIGQARRPETRDRRIAQAIEWLAEGKKRNWKYEGC